MIKNWSQLWKINDKWYITTALILETFVLKHKHGFYW